MTTNDCARFFRQAEDADEAVLEYARAKQSFDEARAALQTHVQGLKASILALSGELSRDALEAALRAVVAIKNGDGDEAYAFARAAVQCVRAVERSDEVLFGTRALVDLPPTVGIGSASPEA